LRNGTEVHFEAPTSAAEAAFLIGALDAALQRRSSTVARRAVAHAGQSQNQGQRQRTRVFAPHERDGFGDEGDAFSKKDVNLSI
jgi:hypothetical protein